MEEQKSIEMKERKLSDIALVTYLVCEGFKIKRIEKDRNKIKSLFVFDETQELKDATLTYFNREAKIEPIQFSETLRNLKSYARQG